MICLVCGATAAGSRYFCRHCGSRLKAPISATGGPVTRDFTAQQKRFFHQEYARQSRNPSKALVLTLLLGGTGAHRFYLRQWGWGIAYLLFAWTFIPLIIAMVECFRIKTRTERYNDDLRRTIVQKAAAILSEPNVAFATCEPQ